MNGHILENVNEEKDLGVIIDNQLKLHTHTSAAIQKNNNSILGRGVFTTQLLTYVLSTRVVGHFENKVIKWSSGQVIQLDLAARGQFIKTLGTSFWK